MGFSWTAISQGGQITGAIPNQLRTNINSVYTSLSLGTAYSNPNLNANAGSITSAQWNDIKTKIDTAKNNNYCRANNSTNYTGVNTTYRSSYDSGDNATVRSSHDTSILSNHDTSYRSSYNAGYDVFNDTGYDNNNKGVCNGYG